jgi:hypothetical protein
MLSPTSLAVVSATSTPAAGHPAQVQRARAVATEAAQPGSPTAPVGATPPLREAPNRVKQSDRAG